MEAGESEKANAWLDERVISNERKRSERSGRLILSESGRSGAGGV